MPSVTGLGSGMDISTMVTSLVNAEVSPKTALLTKRQASVTAEISAVGTLKSALSEFKSAVDQLGNMSDFEARSTSLSTDDYISASAEDDAAPGRYNINVTQLASAQRVKSGEFSGADAVMGTGTLNLSVGDSSFSVEIGEDAQSLADVRDAINDAAGNTGVSATIINADAEDGSTVSRLVLTSDSPGTSKGLSLSVEGASDGAGLSQLAFSTADDGSFSTTVADGGPEQVDAAQDAKLEVMGETITRSSNSISDAIDGISLTLKDVGETTLTIAEDTSAAEKKVQGFVDAYNSMAETLNSLGKYDASTQTGGALLGDATLRNVQSTLRRQMGDTVAGAGLSYSSLAEIGITTTRTGTLEFDSSDFQKALKEDPTGVGKLFASDDGYAQRLSSTLNSYTKSNGLLATRSTSLEGQLTDIADEQTELSTYATTLQDRYLTQFNAMDSLVSTLTTTSNYLTQQLANLPGYTRSSS